MKALEAQMKEAEEAKKKAFDDWKRAREEAKPVSDIADKKKRHAEAIKDFKAKPGSIQTSRQEDGVKAYGNSR